MENGPGRRCGRPGPARSAAVVVALATALAACGSQQGTSPAPASAASLESVAASPESAAASPESAATSSGSAAASAEPAASTPVRQWLAAPTVFIAHHGGSADWPPGSPLAYRNSAPWNPSLALEFSARRTADGVWVGSEDATTGAVYGTDLTIATSTWEQLSTLRATHSQQPMARLDTDLLDTLPADRVLFVDDKDDAHVDELLDLLDQHGGAGRTVVKSYWKSKTTPTEAHRRGYLTWGYYYAGEMDQFAATQSRFDLLGIDWNAPAATYQQMAATGKRIIAHVVADERQARQALAAGATGLMVSGVREVVPQT